MDSLQPVFTGTAERFPLTPGAQGPTVPATAGLFGSGGEFSPAKAKSFGGGIAAGFGAYGQVLSGQQMKAQYDMEAGSYEVQAEVVKLNAKEQAIMLRKQLLQDLGSANASAAARGIDTGSGTPRQIVEESIGNVGRDIERLESGANISAAGSRTSASRSRGVGSSYSQAGYYKGAESIAGYALK